MIELKNDRIIFATIDAWIFGQMLENMLTDSGALKLVALTTILKPLRA